MSNLTGIIKSKVLQQGCDNYAHIPKNKLNFHNFKDGITINISNLIDDNMVYFPSPINIGNSNPPNGTFWINSANSYRLMFSTGVNSINVPDGIYVLSSNIDRPCYIVGWSRTMKAYNIVDGLPLSFRTNGTYIEKGGGKIINVINETGNIAEASNGYYSHTIRGVNKFYQITENNGNGIQLLNGTYHITTNIETLGNINDKIIYGKNGIFSIYYGNFINKSNNTFRASGVSCGCVIDGDIFFCDDKILIKKPDGYQKADLTYLS